MASKLPECSIRFSRAHVDLLIASIEPAKYACTIFIREFPSDGDRSKLELDERVIQLWQRVSDAAIHSRQKCRLRMNAVDAAFVAFSLRAARKSGCLDTQPKTLSLFRSLGALLKKIENFRRRARRASERRLGREQYRLMWDQWTAFRRWLSGELYERRAHPPDGMRKYWMRNLNFLILAARRGLAAVGREIPPDKELRTLVRLAGRYMRRGRTPLGLRALADSPEGAAYLADFISCRWSSAVGIHRKTRQSHLQTTIA